MNTMRMFLLSAICLLLCFAGSTPGGAQGPATESPAERRAKEFIRLLNANDREGFRKYVMENFGGRMRQLPMDAHMNFFSSVYDRTRGVEFMSVQEAKANETTVLVKQKLTGEYGAFIFAVEPEAPHRIVGLGSRQPKPPDGGAARKPEPEAMKRELESFAKKLADADVFSGTVLLAKDGAVIYKGAFGIANKDFNAPNRIDTKFNLGSMNKMFTGVAIAQLAERGKLSFDDPLSKFIPDFPNKEAGEKIKLKHLLTHTAGLGGYFSPKWDETSRARYRTVDDMMKRVAEDEKNVQFEPGSKWQYSNSGMLVLGKVVEVASGQNYFDYVRENIYKPAGMTNTDCYELDRVTPNLAVGYNKEYNDQGFTFTNNVFAHVLRGGPQGGGYSTVEDLLKFDVALRSGKLVGDSYVKTLLSAKPELNSPNYGFGFGVEQNRGVTIAGHGGGFIGINSNLDLFLGTGWTAIVMSNYSGGASPLRDKMRDLILAGRDSGVATR
jgi:CubicO group peptidase (beta-lactamase class C family)